MNSPLQCSCQKQCLLRRLKSQSWRASVAEQASHCQPFRNSDLAFLGLPSASVEQDLSAAPGMPPTRCTVGAGKAWLEAAAELASGTHDSRPGSPGDRESKPLRPWRWKRAPSLPPPHDARSLRASPRSCDTFSWRESRGFRWAKCPEPDVGLTGPGLTFAAGVFGETKTKFGWARTGERRASRHLRLGAALCTLRSDSACHPGPVMLPLAGQRTKFASSRCRMWSFWRVLEPVEPV